MSKDFDSWWQQNKKFYTTGHGAHDFEDLEGLLKDATEDAWNAAIELSKSSNGK